MSNMSVESLAKEEEKDRYTVDRSMFHLQAYSRYRPIFQPIAPNGVFYITPRGINGVGGEGFIDYVNFTATSHQAALTIELDGYAWIDQLSIEQVNAPYFFGLTGSYPFMGCTVYDFTNNRFGMYVKPQKDNAPFYKIFRIWITNPTANQITARIAFYSYRLRGRTRV